MTATMTLDTPRIAGVVRPEDGQRVRAFGDEILFKLTAEQTLAMARLEEHVEFTNRLIRERSNAQLPPAR